MTLPDLCIISCGAAKTRTTTSAHRLYTGNYFKTQLAWARSHYPTRKIRILSAKHGLLKLTDKVAPYDLRMGNPGSVTAQTLAAQLPHKAHIVTSCGADYLAPLQEAATIRGCTITVPFSNYPGMGYKAQAMKRATRKDRNV